MRKNDDDKRKRRQQRRREIRSLIDPADANRLTDEIIQHFGTADPVAQFSAMAIAVCKAVQRAHRDGIEEVEAMALCQAAMLLIEASDGNYTDPRWPDSDPSYSGKASQNYVQGEHAIIELAKRIHIRMGKIPKSKINACLEAAEKVDALLKSKGTTLKKALRDYSLEPSGDPNSDRRQEPARATSERNHPLSRIANRIKTWIDTGRPAADEPHKIDPALLLGCNEQDLAVLSAMMLAWSPKHKK